MIVICIFEIAENFSMLIWIIGFGYGSMIPDWSHTPRANSMEVTLPFVILSRSTSLLAVFMALWTWRYGPWAATSTTWFVNFTVGSLLRKKGHRFHGGAGIVIDTYFWSWLVRFFCFSFIWWFYVSRVFAFVPLPRRVVTRPAVPPARSWATSSATIPSPLVTVFSAERSVWMPENMFADTGCWLVGQRASLLFLFILGVLIARFGSDRTSSNLLRLFRLCIVQSGAFRLVFTLKRGMKKSTSAMGNRDHLPYST